MTTIGAGYEGQTNNTAFTAANSDDTGDDAAAVVSLGSTGAALVYSTDQAMWGTSSLKMSRTGTNSLTYYSYDLGAPAAAGKFRMWIYLTGSPSATADFPFRLATSLDATLATIQMTTGRVLRISAGSAVQGTVGLSLNTWYRIEMQWSNVTSGTGTIDVQAYAGNGSTATDTVSIGSLALASNPQKVRIGELSSGAPTTAQVYFDAHPSGIISDDNATPFGIVNPNTDAPAVEAAVGAAASNASVKVEPNGLAATVLAEALFDPNGGSISLNLNAQDAVRVTAAANDAVVAVAVVGSSTSADVAVAAGDATAGVGPVPQVAAVGAAASDGTASVGAGSIEAVAAAGASDGSTSVGASSVTADVGGAAQDATVTRTGSALPTEAAAGAAAGDATTSVAASAVSADVGAAAGDGLVSTTGLTQAASDVALVGAAASDATVSTSQPAPSTSADVAAAAGDATVATSTAALGVEALVGAAAGDATVSTTGNALPSSQVAPAAAGAGDATITVGPEPAVADVAAAANDALVATSAAAFAQPAGVFVEATSPDAVLTVAVAEPAAEHANAGIVAMDAAVDIMVSAIAAEVVAAAEDSLVYGPPAPGQLRQRRRTAPGIRRRPRTEVDA